MAEQCVPSSIKSAYLVYEHIHLRLITVLKRPYTFTVVISMAA